MLDANTNVDVVLDLAQLNSLSMELDLCIFPSSDMKGAVVVVSDKVACLVHPSRTAMVWLIERPFRINDESLTCLLGLFVVLPSKGVAFDNKFSNSSNWHKTVVVVSVNNPAMDANLVTNVQWVLAFSHASMNV
ncbi:hypothetical protein QX201_002675 [Fusarium graminearum]|nr:hypothetical protein HG531_007105 [Fusarium graminearum]